MKEKSELAIEISGKNYNVTDGYREIALKKCSKLDRYFKKDPSTKVSIVVTRDNVGYTTDMTVVTKGATYRATADGKAPYDNIDVVIPKLLGQVRKQKSIWGKRGDAATKKKSVADAPADDAE